MSDIDNKRPKAILFPRHFDNIPIPFPPDGNWVKLWMIHINGLMNTNNLTDDNQACITAKGEPGKESKGILLPGGKCH